MEPSTGNWPSGPTGRFLVTLRDEPGNKSRVLRDSAGLRTASSMDLPSAAEIGMLGGLNGVVYENVGVAVVDVDPEQKFALARALSDPGNPIIAVEPEQYGHALADRVEGQWRGIGTPYADNLYFTWGLQATGVSGSQGSARDIRVAVLDSGFDLGHPDFNGRNPLARSFVPGAATVQDGFGHGIHVIGTCCGPRRVSGSSRAYGIANDAPLLVGKVLNDAGGYQDEWVIAGISWALANRADIISMSLGAFVFSGMGYVEAYENIAKRALAANSLIIAAAGNTRNSAVYSPANCPSILAVGAVDRRLDLAPFSSIGINPNGGEVNLVGPGVEVHSSKPMTTRYGVMQGTSMATPHVSGCAALWAQATGLRGRDLWEQLRVSARPIGLPTQHGGAGLVQAPQV
ncbi:MAG: S8 family serine peptidase [Gammaproteobacteria bacterium]|nr:S8 family serine peptidase [Gammaproteobacteria bacterium]